MGSKTPLFLLELAVLVLVFALAAVICLQAFVAADRESAENALRDRALIALQNAAESVKSRGCAREERLPAADGMEVRVAPVESGVPGLGKARVAVFSEEICLMETFVCWQKAVSIPDEEP